MANTVNHMSINRATQDEDPEVLIVSLMANLGARLDHTESDAAAAAMTVQLRALSKELAEARKEKERTRQKESDEPTDAIEAAVKASRRK